MAVYILMIVAPKGFRDEECLQPKEILEKNGYKVVLASKGVKTATGMLGAQIPVEKDITKVNIADYSAVIFVGGTGAATYFNDPFALRIAKEADVQGKIVGAICIAPSILANAGVLKGKKATAFPSEEQNLIDKGAEYTGENVTIDGLIVTGKGPQAAKDFGKAIIEALKRR